MLIEVSRAGRPGVEGVVSESVPFPRICVIGAGPSGVAACRALSEWGVSFDCFEKRDSVAASLFDGAEAEGGVDRRSRQGATDCPQACVVAEALESYVSRSGLRPKIAFEHAVEYVLRLPDGSWRVHLERGPARPYDALFVAAGGRRRPSARTHADLLVPDSLPFFDPEEREALRDDLPLWKHLIHPRYRNLFFLARLKTARLTLRIAEEQSKFAAGSIAGDYPLPTRWQMERERRAVQRRAREPGRKTSDCPVSASDTRYPFHLRWERVRRTSEYEAAAGQVRPSSRTRPRLFVLPGAREMARS
jgi:hypothetical protein